MGPTLDENTLAALRELADDDDPDFLIDLIDTYLHDTSASIQTLRSYLIGDSPDRDGTRRVAHTIKGASQNIGAIQVAAHCLELERIADTAESGRLSEVLAEIDGAFAVARDSLGQELARAS